MNPVPKEILKLYEPHSEQLRFHQSTARYRVAAWGRQSGKSTGCLNDLLDKAWRSPGKKFWFVSPTYDQAKTQYRRLVGMLFPCWEILRKKNQTELRIKLINESEIVFKSGEVLQNLRGETLHGVVIDEVRDQHPELWSQVLRPMLTTTHGWAAFVSTPNGFDNFYDLYTKAKRGLDGWESFSAPSTCNPYFKETEFEAAKKEMSEGVFAQEILAEFRDITSGKAYLNHGSWNQKEENPFAPKGLTLSPHLPIIVGLDFNVHFMRWTLMQNKADDWYAFDEVAPEGTTNTQECAPLLLEKVKHHGPGVTLVGDASGNSKHASATATDYAAIISILEGAGVRVQNLTPLTNPPVKDRVNLFNAKLKSADGTSHFWYHPDRVAALKKDLERVTWKNGTGQLQLEKVKYPELTHASDGVGYPLFALTDAWRPSPGTIRIIRR